MSKIKIHTDRSNNIFNISFGGRSYFTDFSKDQRVVVDLDNSGNLLNLEIYPCIDKVLINIVEDEKYTIKENDDKIVIEFRKSKTAKPIQFLNNSYKNFKVYMNGSRLCKVVIYK